jgi:hypothetical protein
MRSCAGCRPGRAHGCSGRGCRGRALPAPANRHCNHRAAPAAIGAAWPQPRGISTEMRGNARGAALRARTRASPRPENRQCGRGDSNPQGSLHWILSPARLPVPPLPRVRRPGSLQLRRRQPPCDDSADRGPRKMRAGAAPRRDPTPSRLRRDCPSPPGREGQLRGRGRQAPSLPSGEGVGDGVSGGLSSRAAAAPACRRGRRR